MHKIPQAKYLTLDELFNLVNLHLLDQNNDDMIDEQDPIYQHLFIVRFKKNGQEYDMKNLKTADIRAILIQRLTPTGNHVVIMQDGSERILYNVNKFE